MTDRCNHTSVGVIPMRDGKVLLFQRQKFPLKKAPCAGHVDSLPRVPTGDRSEQPVYRTEGVKELQEETGLVVPPSALRLVHTERTPNQCRRQTVDGDEPWHLWRVYTVNIDPTHTPQGNADESADLRWYTPGEIRALPDLEEVWRSFLTTLRII